MDWENQTGLPAMLYRAAIDETTMICAVVARITHHIEGTRLAPAESQPWIVSGPPWAGPEGPMPSDEVFRRGGVDLLLFGNARAPSSRPVSEVPVRVRCGDHFSHEVVVLGERVWQRQGQGFVASEPAPFLEMPIRLDRAFGGKSRWDGLDVTYPDNPDGKGFCAEEDGVEGTPLPNVENPKQRITRWEDRPDPVGLGLCPPALGPKLRQSVSFDDSGMLEELRPTFYNAAFPEMIVPGVEPGQVVSIEGMTCGPPLSFEVPPAALSARVRIGDSEIERPLALDQIGVQVDARAVFLTYRFPFRYTLRPRERRTCALAFAAGAAQ
jgi:hypothetical protein